MPPEPLQPISITLGNATSQAYKSIDRISWNDIPPFAVLTGVNGSGKTQFLQALSYKISGVPPNGQRHHPTTAQLNSMPFSVTGAEFAPDDLAYLPNSENALRVQGTNISDIAQAKMSFLQRLQPQNADSDIEIQILRHRVQRKYGLTITGNPTQAQCDLLPDDFLYMLEYTDVSAGLSHVFMGYQISRAEMLLQGKTDLQIREALGAPPWEFVNAVLASAEFAYRIPPPDNRLMQSYVVQLQTADGAITIPFDDLSSGERMILRTILWFYNSKHNNIFPKLILLDEPDAHLHPSMTRQFINVLKDVLVDQYNVRIILTTHSPSTVALAPEESIFVMSRAQPRIRQAQSKAEAIGLLTSGLVIVSAGTRFVLVEDESDVTFYSAVRDILSDQGPSNDPMSLRPEPSIVFMASSRGAGSGRTGGGSTVVTQWVNKLDTPPLSEMFRGIIDLDTGNIATPRVRVLSRYSIENYQLDPLTIFGVLIDERIAPAITNLSTAAGDEHLLRTLDSSALQPVVDYVANRIAPVLQHLTATENHLRTVKFTNGVELQYPAWMLTRRGHDLLPTYQRVFGQTYITPPKLEKSLRRTRMMPIELAEMMRDLQN